MSAISNEIASILNHLSADKQRRVLNFVRSLDQFNEISGTPVEDLLQFVGSLPEEIVQEMERAIETGCERIEPDDPSLSF